MESIEIRYLDIVWSKEKTVLKVEASHQTIELYSKDKYLFADTVTYPKQYFYIGICITGKLLYEPYLKLPNDQVSPLTPVTAPGTDKTWWFQQGKWDKDYDKYLSSIYRTAGRIEISAQNETIILENHTVNFSLEDLEYYLSDLKGKLWMLMLDSKSACKINLHKKTPSIFSNEVIRLFGELASSFEAVIKKPHVSLHEIQEKRLRRSVKPVPKTFREIATQSTPKLLTSRSYRESYDTPENRFIHYLGFRALYLLKALNRLLYHQLNSLRDKEERDERWLRDESRKITKVVDSLVIDNEIQTIRLDLQNKSKKLRECVGHKLTICQPDDYHKCESFVSEKFCVKFSKLYGISGKQYYVSILNGEYFKSKYLTDLVLTSVVNFKEILESAKLWQYEFEIIGTGLKLKKVKSINEFYYEIFFESIDSIEIKESPLALEINRLTQSRKRLEYNGWVVKLNREELESINNQAKIVSHSLSLVKSTLHQLLEIENHIPILMSRIKNSVRFFQSNKVGQQQECPNSMVFVQNPLYASAKFLYRKVSNLEGMDDSLLNSMMVIDEIGLVNLPALYERWCLTQLIIVIRDIYNFEIQEGWQQKLIDAVLKNGRNVEIDFTCERRQLDLKLTFEKEFITKKRPDYVIDLYHKKYERKHDNSTSLEESTDSIQWYIQKTEKKRMVLDAKFRGNVGEQHIDDLVTELCEDKNYSEDEKNSVFVIHPVAKVIDVRTSSLGWGPYCNYGQAGKTDHRKGAIYLSPSRQHSNSIDNLQRLIGMLLQKHTTILDDGERGRVIWHNKCCISCGGQDLSIILDSTQAKNNVNNIRCNSCGQKTIETQCVSCKRQIYKNGINWTYHRTRAEQTTNIVCPECETFL